MKKESPFIQSLKNIKPLDLVYPVVLVLFFGVVIGVFFSVMQFISQSINSAFSSEDSGSAQSLDFERYKLIAKKLNIPVAIPQEGMTNVVIPETPATIPEVATTTQATSTPVAVVLDKRAITLAVKNSTPKKGVATTLAKALEDAGFQKPQTGNEPKSYATTTVLIKESKKEYESLLLEVVHKIYPSAIATTTKENTSSDAIIIIGNL